MNDKELFNECVKRLENEGVSMSGTFVTFKGNIEFNTDGWSFGYNLQRLGMLLNDKVEW